jgi:hypothetical protein
MLEERGLATVHGLEAHHEAHFEVSRAPRRLAAQHPRDDDIPHFTDYA